ncbi:MAG: 7-carboxy-7-deazaguanine synthase [Proteobacteria bacterium]|nr:7-carboxy-7-deazaguanine synthase [Pseudomonadota bacterium]
MTYTIKEMFFTYQGEGARTGRASLFVRFAGCNLWSGLEKDRAGAVCKFCDTDFVGTNGPGGGKFKSAEELAKKASTLWPGGNKYAVFTGGEPLLQLDDALTKAFHAEGFQVAVESNGTIEAPEGIDWLTVSPKADAPLEQTSGDELKLVYPQVENNPEDFEGLDFKVFSLQPMDGPALKKNTEKTLIYCAAHPGWRLSLQAHKIWDIA